ncbi:hypothetical protein [Mycobacterium sp. 1245852.3]|uniref:hypothetical protein n=1 Tax=Mycobacterium sp. 1245852.3 TaxID=1856860 RepID=UPI000800DF8F|nr:hypothetical protein [Mycobacterium sp. 1245852.3]OBJ81083.1 hypothetical protein A9W96_29505 [Mycobacterium sp. 1245852.3]
MPEDQLAAAIADYESNWKPVDSELYELCSRRRAGHDDFDDAYTKVVIVGRVYAAGISRSWGGDPGKDPESEVARALIDDPRLIDDGLRRLEGRPFDHHAAGQIVRLHSDVTRAISHTSVKYLTSFVSKYLHFHCPIVPIFDARADAAMGKLINRRGRPVRDNLTELPDGVLVYRSFVAAFIALAEQYAQRNPKPTVKQLDHLLWRLMELQSGG